MKPRKKNRFLAFVLSFIPGASEMYMGFMKSGISILLAFVTPLFLTGVFYGADYISFLSAVVYAIAFFHANNLASTSKEEFDLIEDKFIWEELINVKNISIPAKTVKKWGAVALIFLGASGIWSLLSENIIKLTANMSEQDRQIIRSVLNSVPRLAFSIIVITIGVLLIMGKKKMMDEENFDEIIADGSLEDKIIAESREVSVETSTVEVPAESVSNNEGAENIIAIDEAI